ncbi:hypothetical protein FOXYSP1_19248 [Fusarium oxysporum f. sp. phaseoli]
MPQWEYVVQLFQTNFLDSLVRYFASYLPTDHIWHPPYQDTALAATYAFSTSPLPKRRCKRHKTNKGVGSGRQTLVSSSIELRRLPAKDQLLASDKALESTCPAAFSLFSERPLSILDPMNTTPISTIVPNCYHGPARNLRAQYREQQPSLKSIWNSS